VAVSLEKNKVTVSGVWGDTKTRRVCCISAGVMLSRKRTPRASVNAHSRPPDSRELGGTHLWHGRPRVQKNKNEPRKKQSNCQWGVGRHQDAQGLLHLGRGNAQPQTHPARLGKQKGRYHNVPGQ